LAKLVACQFDSPIALARVPQAPFHPVSRVQAVGDEQNKKQSRGLPSIEPEQQRGIAEPSLLTTIACVLTQMHEVMITEFSNQTRCALERNAARNVKVPSAADGISDTLHENCFADNYRRVGSMAHRAPRLNTLGV
jgi:hypothetical protein